MNSNDKKIFISFKFPMAKGVSYNLFENLVIPKLYKGKIIVADNVELRLYGRERAERATDHVHKVTLATANNKSV